MNGKTDFWKIILKKNTSQFKVEIVFIVVVNFSEHSQHKYLQNHVSIFYTLEMKKGKNKIHRKMLKMLNSTNI